MARITSVKIKGEVFGATADKRGPIGGGAGYKAVLRDGDFMPATIEDLIDALGKARAGQVVFLAGDLDLDLTTYIHIDKLVLAIPEGVTLASDRGARAGKRGRVSRGAALRSDTLATKPMIRVPGPNARVTGLRIIGPDPETREAHHQRCCRLARPADNGFNHELYYKFPNSDGILVEHDRFELDNCELAAFSHAGVFLRRGRGHLIHHNHIHHHQYNGLGYGVCHDVATSLIECNVFDYNRHSIAGTGAVGSGYEARNNVEFGHHPSHRFDLHGGRDRGDGTNIAGDHLSIHHNTFLSTARAVAIRGVTTNGADIHHNWFAHADTSHATIAHEVNTNIGPNACGRRRPRVVRD